jgi:hypothetical protein
MGSLTELVQMENFAEMVQMESLTIQESTLMENHIRQESALMKRLIPQAPPITTARILLMAKGYREILEEARS